VKKLSLSLSWYACCVQEGMSRPFVTGAQSLLLAAGLLACAERQAPATATGVARVRIENTTSNSLYVAHDGQQRPQWLHIGSPELALNAYGLDWCDAPGVHNDPRFFFDTIAPGTAIEYAWNGIHIVGNGTCWSEAHAPAGTFPSRACVFETKPADGYLPGFNDAGATERCEGASVTLPASGEQVTLVTF
jgi:hypothetical protein